MVGLFALTGLLSVWEIYVASFVNSTLTIAFVATNFAAIPSLIYGIISTLVFLMSAAFWITPLGHAERYVMLICLM